MTLRTFAATGIALLAFAGSAFAQGTTVPPLSVKPAEIAADKLTAGIKASYWYASFEHVDEFEKATKAKQGWTPAPIAALDQCANNGKMYEAGVTENYGIKGTGFIKFPREGEWKLAARTNDGLRLMLAGTLAIEDPGIHKTRMSKPASVTVSAPGAVPLDFLFFQKKEFACFELHWQGPGDAAMTLVPASAYAHQKP